VSTSGKLNWPGLALLVAILAAGGAALFLTNRGASVGNDETAVLDLLTSLGPISAALDAERFADHFSLDDLLARVRKDGPIEGVTTPEEEKAFLTAVRQSLVEQVAGMKGTGSLWTSVRPTHVQVTPGEATAHALIRIALPGGVSPARFWAIRKPDGWKVVDFELLDEGRRLTSHARATYEVFRKNPVNSLAMAESSRREKAALAKLTAGDAAGALEDARLLRQLARHPSAQTTARTVELIALGQLGRHEEGLVAVDRYIAESPDAPCFHLMRAHVLHALERWEDASKAGERYLTVVKSDPRAYLVIGLSREKLGRVDEAISALRKGVAEDPDDAEDAYHLGRLLLSRGDRAGASVAFVQMVRSWPHDSSYYDLAAQDLRKAGAAEELLQLDRARRR
jgi:hypothetical protein